MQTGNLDEAVWMNPGDDVTSMSLQDVDEMETDEYAGNYLEDNVGSPELTIQSITTNSVLINWPLSSFASFSLQQNSDLTTTNWVNVTNATSVMDGEDQVILPTTAAQSFFRLYSTTLDAIATPVGNPGGGSTDLPN